MVLGKCWGRDGGAGALRKGKDISLLSLALEVWVTPALSGLLPVHTNSGVASDSLEVFKRTAVIPSKSSSSDRLSPTPLLPLPFGKKQAHPFPLTRCPAGLLPQNSTLALNGGKNPFPQGPKRPYLCTWQPTERGQEPATSSCFHLHSAPPTSASRGVAGTFL